MITIIIFLGMILLGIISIKLRQKYYNELLEVFGGISVILGSVCLIMSMIAIMVAYIRAPKIIQENSINYSGLCKRYEVIKSDYEDVSKSDVIADITAWNITVYNTKYWTNNPWTNWYNPKEIADNLNYISLE